MQDIDEQLTGLIHDWFSRLRGHISAGNSEFLGGDHTMLERERILLTIGGSSGGIVQKRLSACRAHDLREIYPLGPKPCTLAGRQHDGHYIVFHVHVPPVKSSVMAR